MKVSTALHRFLSLAKSHYCWLFGKMISAALVFAMALAVSAIARWLPGWSVGSKLYESLLDYHPIIIFIMMLAVAGLFSPGIRFDDSGGLAADLKESWRLSSLVRVLVLLVDATCIFTGTFLGALSVDSFCTGDWRYWIFAWWVLFSVFAVIPLVTSLLHYAIAGDSKGLSAKLIICLCLVPITALSFPDQIHSLIFFTYRHWLVLGLLYLLFICSAAMIGHSKAKPT